MEVVAKARYLRISPRKVRLVAKAIKDLAPAEALANLRFLSKSGARPLAKVINSALASAKNNYGLDASSLRLKSIKVEGGPVLKRWQPVSRGRAHPILKRTSHLMVVLEGEKS